MTDEEALKEIERQEKRFAAAKCGRQAAQGRPQRRADQESGTQGPPHVRGEGEASRHNAGGVGLAAAVLRWLIRRFVGSGVRL